MPQRLLTILATALLFLGLSLPGARAIEAGDPTTLVNKLVEQAIGNIKDKQSSDTDRQMKFRQILESGFDIPRISRFVLGRYWNGSNDEDRKTFSELFEDWIVRTYAARFRDYSGQVIQVTGTRPESETSTVVLSQFTNPNSNAPPAKVEWHVRKGADKDFKVIDVSVEGVSMALTQRDEIASVADRNGGTIAGLNKALQQRLASSDNGPSAQ